MSSVELSISDVLGRAWELAKKHWAPILLFSFVAGMVAYVLGQIIWSPLSVWFPSSDIENLELEDLKVFLIYWAFAILIIFIIQSILNIGVYNMYLRAMRGTAPNFSAFKLPVHTYFHCILVCFIMALIWIGFILYLIYCVCILYKRAEYFVETEDFVIMLIALTFLLLLIGSCFVRLMYAVLLIIDTRSCNAWKAMNISWQMTKGRFWQLFALGIVLVLIHCVGYVCCFIGVLFTSVISGFAFVVSYEILKLQQNNDTPSPTPFRRPASQDVPPVTTEAAPERREQTPEEWIEAVLASKEKAALVETSEPEKKIGPSTTIIKEGPKVEGLQEKHETDDLYDVVLLDAGDRCDEVVRTIMGGVYDKTADEIRILIEAVPSVLMEKVPYLQANRMKTLLEEVGARVRIR